MKRFQSTYRKSFTIQQRTYEVIPVLGHLVPLSHPPLSLSLSLPLSLSISLSPYIARCTSACISVVLSVCLSVCLTNDSLSVCKSVSLCHCLFSCLSFCVFVCLNSYSCLSICVSVCPFTPALSPYFPSSSFSIKCDGRSDYISLITKNSTLFSPLFLYDQGNPTPAIIHTLQLLCTCSYRHTSSFLKTTNTTQ